MKEQTHATPESNTNCMIMDLNISIESGDQAVLSISTLKPDLPLTDKLKIIYSSRVVLPKPLDEEDIKSQSFSQYYIKPKIFLHPSSCNIPKASEHNCIEREKVELVVEEIFAPLEGHPIEVNKVLLLGVTGVGKTTIANHALFQWGNSRGSLWNNKFDFVFLIRLGEILDYKWKDKYETNKADLRKDKLSYLIHYCLDDDEKKYGIEPQHIKNIKDISKVLLILDGYDDIAQLPEDRGDYRDIIGSVFKKYSNIFMISRPNVLNKYIWDKFTRKLQTQGYDSKEVDKYINIYFNPHSSTVSSAISAVAAEENGKANNHDQSIQIFLSHNSQIKSLLETPLITGLFCLIWNKIKSAAGGEAELNISQLYHKLIAFFATRYLQKNYKTHLEEEQDQAEKNMQQFIEKFITEIQEIKKQLTSEITFLTKIAYDSFVEDSQLVSEYIINRHIGTLNIESINKLGLLKVIEKEEVCSLLELDYHFIHPTFQEYLVACYLKDRLLSESTSKVFADFINTLKINKKSFMILKFLAGMVMSEAKAEATMIAEEATKKAYGKQLIVSEENTDSKLIEILEVAAAGWSLAHEIVMDPRVNKGRRFERKEREEYDRDQRKKSVLVEKFWQIISNNLVIDKMPEPELENNVIMLMHLLGQDKVKRIENSKIPAEFLSKMKCFINMEVRKDIAKWQKYIIESGYLYNETSLTSQTQIILYQSHHITERIS